MGIFSSMNAAAGSGAAAFNRSRWAPVLQSLDIKFATDDDGDHFGDWDGVRVWFECRGNDEEVLVARAIWDIRPPLDAYEQVALATNLWNSEHMWPRVYVYRGDSECLVMADLVIDCETGASDDFVRQQVRCLLSTAFELVEYLPTVLPESASWHNVDPEAGS